jgi:hypothetical protein
MVRPLFIHRHRLEDTIKVHMWGMIYKVVDWIHAAQDTDQWRALVNTVMNLPVT